MYKKVSWIIVLAQFLCTSLWFAGNAVFADLMEHYQLGKESLAWLTSSVQLGFISGTLFFAIFTIADRFSPSRVFFISAVLAAFFNLFIICLWDFPLLIAFRFLTGFFLAGIYPVGMKIAADYFEKGLGATLGFLVGALVLGTAFPHLLNALSANLSWELVIYATSILSVLGGIMIYCLVPDGPFRKKGTGFNPKLFLTVFTNQAFRKAAFGYFGHMWELYGFWAFVPFIWLTYFDNINIEYSIETVSLYSFLIIGSGSLACTLAGYLSYRLAVHKIATLSLGLSAFCCLLFPFIVNIVPFPFFFGFMLIWGMSVIADSPMFSTLVAQRAPASNRATALTIVNSIGFALTILSIMLCAFLQTIIPFEFALLLLLPGPILGLNAFAKS